MTNEDKDRFCAFAAALFAPPDAALADELQQEGLTVLLDGYCREWGGRVPTPFSAAAKTYSLAALQEEYERLFGQRAGEKISLIESTYKPWTREKECGMAFAASKGLVMGDSALHMRAIYQQLSLEVPAGFQSTPDHLTLELELLALLYRYGSQGQIAGFIEDHLDWIPELQEELEKADSHSFYRTAVELVHLFLRSEANNTKG